MSDKKIKLGVFGAGRGAYLANVARQIGFELVALCDVFEAQLRHAKKTLGGDDWPWWRRLFHLLFLR